MRSARKGNKKAQWFTSSNDHVIIFQNLNFVFSNLKMWDNQFLSHRQILVEQEEQQLDGTWYKELEEKSKNMGIGITKKNVEKF